MFVKCFPFDGDVKRLRKTTAACAFVPLNIPQQFLPALPKTTTVIIIDTCVNDQCPIFSNTRCMRRQVMSARPFNCSQSRQCKTPHRHVATCSRQHSYLLQEKWKLKKGSPVCTCFARFLFGGRLVAWQTEHAGVSNESIWINLGHWFGSGLVGIATAETLELDGISLYIVCTF